MFVFIIGEKLILYGTVVNFRGDQILSFMTKFYDQIVTFSILRNTNLMSDALEVGMPR